MIGDWTPTTSWAMDVPTCALILEKDWCSSESFTLILDQKSQEVLCFPISLCCGSSAECLAWSRKIKQLSRCLHSTTIIPFTFSLLENPVRGTLINALTSHRHFEKSISNWGSAIFNQINKYVHVRVVVGHLCDLACIKHSFLKQLGLNKLCAILRF